MSDYPREALDIKLIVEGDDVDTIAAALAVSGAPHIDVVIVPPAAPRTKPKALNAALAHASGDYVVIYDAEDRPHPLQLRAALAAFEDGPANLALRASATGHRQRQRLLDFTPVRRRIRDPVP